MGTRNSTIVTLNKKVRVAQYGQWDGYPTGQGKTIQKFLQNVNMEDFKKKVNALREPTKLENEAIEKMPDWENRYPHLSRDAGADVLNMIAAGDVEFVVLDKDFKYDGLMCEYWYDINLDDETVTMNGNKYTINEWIQPGFMELLEERIED